MVIGTIKYIIMSDSLTIYQAMAKILADIDYIGKDRQADMGNAGRYKFRGIDDIYNALHSSFAKHKVFILPKVLDSKIEIQEKEKTYNGVTSKSYACSAILTIEFTFMSEDGSSVTAIGIGQALDQSDKASSKAQSNALKYCLMQTFLIPTEESKDIEDDNIAVSANKVTPSGDLSTYQASLKQAFDILNWDATKKGNWIKSISSVPVSKWGQAEYMAANEKIWVEVRKTNSLKPTEHRSDKLIGTIENRLDAVIGTKDAID
jgi:hypothetical protein